MGGAILLRLVDFRELRWTVAGTDGREIIMYLLRLDLRIDNQSWNTQGWLLHTQSTQERA